jgi:hypothetical protein
VRHTCTLVGAADEKYARSCDGCFAQIAPYLCGRGGLDFTVLYPTLGLAFPHLEHAELRQATCRALNTFNADYFRAYADRMTPAAVIPMHTPQEAVAELAYTVNELGLKVMMLARHVQGPIPAAVQKESDIGQYAFWLDTFCLDSASYTS